MASYSDRTPNFAPYVQQLPIDQMVSVGMQKQNLYDQGIQKIQTSIDNVAGLDVIRDVDKQYLQSRLNELGTNLKSVAAADFSNNQMVTSTAGMASRIGKDKNIQNAVYSTANHRKQLTIMDAARVKGESAPENEVDYQKQLMQYMNSNKPGELFNSQYTPYINVNEKLFAIGKEVGLDESTVQQLFKTDENGRPITNKDGVPEFNPVMVERHLKGKDPAKILLAFQNALTPADYNQLAITGRYAKSGMSPEQLTGEIVNNYSKDILFSKGKVTELDLALTKANSENKKDNTLIDSLNKQRDYFLQQKNSLENSQAKDIQRVSINPDGVRANLYTSNYLSSMARTLSSSTKEDLNKINPQFEVNMKLNDFNRQVQKDRLDSQHWDMDYKFKVEDRIYNKEKDRLEFQAKYGDLKGAPGTDVHLSIPDNKYAIVGAAEDNYSADMAEYNSNNNSLTEEVFKDTYPMEAGEKIPEYNNRIRMRMSELAISQGKSINPNSGELNKFASDFAAQKLAEWTKDDKAIPLKYRAITEQQNKLSTSLQIQKAKMERIDKEAREEAKAQGLKIPTLAELKTKIKEITLNLPSGSITIPKEDVIDFTNLHPEVHNTFVQFSVDKQQKIDRDQALLKLSQKYGNRFGEIEKKLYGIEPLIPGIDATNTALNIHPTIESAAHILSGTDIDKITEIKAQKYIDSGYLKPPKSFPLIRGKENKDDINNKVIGIINNYPDNLTGYAGTNTEDLKKTVLSSKEGAVNFVVTPGMSSRQSPTYDMIITPDTGKPVPIRINAQEFTYLSKHPAMISQDKPLVLEQLDETGKSSFPSKDFVNLKGVDYTVTGELEYEKRSIGYKGPKNLIYNLYIHRKGESTPEKLTYPESFSAMNPDDSFNSQLDLLPMIVTANYIDQLRKNK